MIPNEATGLNLLLAIRDHALSEAVDLEKAATDLRGRAQEMEARAGVLRQVYAVAAPHFPAVSMRRLAG